MTTEPGGPTNGMPISVDAHGHISHVEARDVVDQYDRTFMYGMSHRDNLYLMDTVGVDMQIIQCADPHGTSYEYQHEYVRRVVREHPDRFAAITAIDERKLPSDEGLELIRKHVEDWGFKAWWFAPWPPEELVAAGFDPKEWGDPNPTYYFDHERYDPQWELVQSLERARLLHFGAAELRGVLPGVVERAGQVPGSHGRDRPRAGPTKLHGPGRQSANSRKRGPAGQRARRLPGAPAGTRQTQGQSQPLRAPRRGYRSLL